MNPLQQNFQSGVEFRLLTTKLQATSMKLGCFNGWMVFLDGKNPRSTPQMVKSKGIPNPQNGLPASNLSRLTWWKKQLKGNWYFLRCVGTNDGHDEKNEDEESWDFTCTWALRMILGFIKLYYDNQLIHERPLDSIWCIRMQTKIVVSRNHLCRSGWMESCGKIGFGLVHLLMQMNAI